MRVFWFYSFLLFDKFKLILRDVLSSKNEPFVFYSYWSLNYFFLLLLLGDYSFEYAILSLHALTSGR